MLRTIMEMFHYPLLNFFVIYKKLEKLENEGKNPKTKIKYSLSRFVKSFDLSNSLHNIYFIFCFYSDIHHV